MPVVGMAELRQATQFSYLWISVLPAKLRRVVMPQGLQINPFALQGIVRQKGRGLNKLLPLAYLLMAVEKGRLFRYTQC